MKKITGRYVNSRRYGSAPHAEFGLDFERFLMLVTGITNIRDVNLFPEYADASR